MRAQSILIALLLFIACGAATAERPIEQQEEWMALLLDGHKTGHMHSQRMVFEDRVESVETVHLELTRSGVTIEMTTVDRAIETPAGKPLGFSSSQSISGSEMEITGRIEGDTLIVDTLSGGSRQTQTLPWPDGALLAEGLRLAMEKHGLEPGTAFTVTAFIPSSLQAADAEVRIGETESVDLFGVELELIRTEQIMELGNTRTTILSWMDQDLNAKKVRFSIMGMSLETIACPRSCALADVEPAEFFTQTFVASPASIDADQRALTYIIQSKGDADIHFPDSDEQTVVEREDGAFEVTVRRLDGSGGVGGFNPADTEPYLAQTRWLQSEAPEIVSMARRAGGNATSPADRMARLEELVRDYVSEKNLSVGYASALETVRSRSGDCTEHALLLAALGRAAGIPTRVATGLAYVENWLGAQRVFVPHAWAQALIDGRWVSFDAALRGFDVGHLALGYGDGDPWHFYDGVNTLGNFVIKTIRPAQP